MNTKYLLASCTALALTGCDTAPDEAAESVAESQTSPVQAAPTVDSVSLDAKVPGTDYHATAQIPCGFGGSKPTLQCDAGVKRNWGEDGTTLVEVKKPDGFTRAIFFKGTEPYSADSAQSDGSAGWDFTTTRDGDRVTINFGPESYVIVDAFVEGG